MHKPTVQAKPDLRMPPPIKQSAPPKKFAPPPIYHGANSLQAKRKFPPPPIPGIVLQPMKRKKSSDNTPRRSKRLNKSEPEPEKLTFSVTTTMHPQASTDNSGTTQRKVGFQMKVRLVTNQPTVTELYERYSLVQYVNDSATFFSPHGNDNFMRNWEVDHYGVGNALDGGNVTSTGSFTRWTDEPGWTTNDRQVPVGYKLDSYVARFKWTIGDIKKIKKVGTGYTVTFKNIYYESPEIELEVRGSDVSNLLVYQLESIPAVTIPV